MNPVITEKQNPSVAAVTLGCKLNYSETSAILDRFSAEGWRISSIEAGADLIIVHTCAVTGQAEQKCRQTIRRMIRRHPRSCIAVIGCYAQLRPELLADIRGVHAILGSNDKFAFELYRDVVACRPDSAVVRVSGLGESDVIHPGYSIPGSFASSRTRAFLKIQDGCDYGCAYCTIPLARGRSRSLSPEMIVDRAHELAASGYREIVLTGVNIGDYRCDGKGFAELLLLLEPVTVERIRISSLEPDILDDALLQVVASSKKIAPHFHVPLQGGSDGILKAMRRRYTTSAYRDRITAAVAKIGDCAVGIDVIAGYPGETADEFRQMCCFLEDLPAAYLHVFSCSVRPGTSLAQQVTAGERCLIPPQEANRRSRLLIELGKRKRAEFVSRFVGRECDILVEDCSTESEGELCCTGYTGNYLHVRATAKPGAVDVQSLKGRMFRVLTSHLDDDLNLRGRLLF
ncbi:MAG: MiaB/RimO family radical SAM methylthiotransferase [Chlorobium sp.]|jgi:threonylcarbamoyladenosine tRNA methylthiotransferase MtaB|uniref:MiaB/RimO family radical SAM methylthiotransferase n=1 Tax=Chlorobium sp. TaxID=1095 RepID=UPI0025BA9792|nr:MiaB/RimO family radical SAM methylthiotransferase [Chlorobium sp.]MCF8215373.1 MiaB/RimO family radical SAM methylthiotransferase [Chlorobium sp.]MCF8270211.1 MiaB/RimO family radical SAM methylthiotransferase [Chlorobium sp.]MCF8286580.1 MiaB/RimO family radical SAM methylthiotransferase [Chlorobium sp.]MCF8290179.1 MiaB/RimO family radical SAM methylthiotransferase [Chlorobium sp.]MCF8384338.1 MiaB/RimO family radical SAM methylthiotransferase [Chlorobium sp.]